MTSEGSTSSSLSSGIVSRSRKKFCWGVFLGAFFSSFYFFSFINLSIRVRLFIHSWGFNWNCVVQLFTRRCTSRYLLRGCPFPLRTQNGGSICINSCFCKLVSFNNGFNDKPKMIKNSVFYYIYWSQLNFLPNTLPWLSGYTSAIFRLPGRSYIMKCCCENWVNYFCSNRVIFPIYFMRSPCKTPTCCLKNTHKN